MEIISGIYKIENKVNGKVYIGSSKNINSRWKQHINMLKNKKHHSIKLQRAWDKYDEDSFEFSVLEECDEEKLLYLEQYYIDKYKAYFEGYNSKEKTRDIYTEEDYVRDNIAENNASALINVAMNLKHSNMVFFDKKTWNNVSNKKENIKNFQDEYLIYRDIMIFVNKYFSDYSDILIVVRNNRKENFTSFICFSENQEHMNFELHLKNEGIIVECKIFVNDRSIIIENSVDEEGYNLIFSNSKLKRDAHINELMPYIYFPNKERERLTDEYFKKLIYILYKNNIGHPSRYKYIYGECDGFIKEFYEYVLREKLSFFMQKGKYANEHIQINPTDKNYKQLLLRCLEK